MMNRQSTVPVQFPKTTRKDVQVRATSGRGGKVLPVGYIPILRNDRVSGTANFDIRLAELAKPLINGAIVKVHCWLVPKSAHPQFAGMDEFRQAYTGQIPQTMRASNGTLTNPLALPQFFRQKAHDVSWNANPIFKTLGIHMAAGETYNLDLLDAISVVDNFRRKSLSSKLPQRGYVGQAGQYDLPRAYWMHNRFSDLVPDYEQALTDGQVDLTLQSGTLPISSASSYFATANYMPSSNSAGTVDGSRINWGDEIRAEMAGQGLDFTLATLDKARETASFARMRQAMSGAGSSELIDPQALIDDMMRGFAVPEDALKQPIMLGQQSVPIGMTERHATDAANLDQSVTTGQVSINMSFNTPTIPTGGLILFFAEVVPERMDERATDPWLQMTEVSQLPDALRDTLDENPVDTVPNRLIDQYHTAPDGLFGFVPRNALWNRKMTALGGKYFAPTPGTQPTENRFGVWAADTIDPTFSEDWYLVPSDLSHYPFADTAGDAIDVVFQAAAEIEGITQFGVPLMEDQSEYASIIDASE